MSSSSSNSVYGGIRTFWKLTSHAHTDYLICYSTKIRYPLESSSFLYQSLNMNAQRSNLLTSLYFLTWQTCSPFHEGGYIEFYIYHTQLVYSEPMVSHHCLQSSFSIRPHTCVSSTSDIPPTYRSETKLTAPLGVEAMRTLTGIMVFIVRPSGWLELQVSRCFKEYFTGIDDCVGVDVAFLEGKGESRPYLLNVWHPVNLSKVGI